LEHRVGTQRRRNRREVEDVRHTLAVPDETAADPWAALGERFVGGHYGSLRGRVRTHVIHEHLRAHLPPPPGAIVDVGGGAGHQSLPLAVDGYDVTVVDPSPWMLERAAERAAAAGVADRVALVEGSGEAAPGVLGGRRYGGVLSHGVLMYLEDPAPMLDALVSLAAPGGIVSIVAKNAQLMAMRPALAGDWAAALDAFDRDRQVNGLGVETRGDGIDALSGSLRERGVDPLAWYGVRLFTDGWAPDRPATDPEDLVLAVELEATRRDPYRRLSRLFHLVGRRTGE
jgi:S-adenosylmethionine-dependent methyltransferase